MPLHRIVVLNPKGGSGKTTVATNLAAYFASQGMATALLDHDSQGSSTRWLSKRPEDAAPIHGIPKDQLEGEDIRQHRKARRLRRAAVTGLVLLTVASITAGQSKPLFRLFYKNHTVLFMQL